MYLNPLEVHLRWNLCLNTTSRLNKMKCLYQPSVDDSERYMLYYILSFSRDKSPRVSNLLKRNLSRALMPPCTKGATYLKMLIASSNAGCLGYSKTLWRLQNLILGILENSQSLLTAESRITYWSPYVFSIDIWKWYLMLGKFLAHLGKSPSCSS